MPIKPSAQTYRCPACNWSKTVVPNGDALIPGDISSACPKCGHKQLESKKASAILEAFTSLIDVIRH
ncbi:hypothetical protein ETQ85_14305 [Zoogloea oleivorans]|jgi:predicted RNA-binding Zn-ribbon protein involved in translation (DUF1610 family)|uniref:Uncharacterized protein n=1 Tax=Zoogloea oleivorans TaxID=1552750 RepID=A0A6C2CP50_9RHOO|nr:hypothetical protein ETQ85_14305 [Zoogloea oleivorans]